MKRALIFIAAVVAFIVLTPVVVFVWVFYIGPMLHPAAPPLLQHVTAGGGYFGACPPKNSEEAAQRAKSGEALSELNQRLAQQFPPGSPEQLLVRSLSEQGFTPLEPCENDATVRRAHFTGPVRGGIFDVNAVVYWKTQNDTLVWTKGFVSFNGF
jgi:hypothetical protein